MGLPLGAYRKRASLALGRDLRWNEHVHHHTLTQLVICTKEYHHWLHRRMRERGIQAPVLPWASKGKIIAISEAAHQELRKRAYEQRRTMKAVLERLVEEYCDLAEAEE